VITCAEAVRRLWEYLDQALPEAEREGVQEHLEFCRRCCGELEFAREVQRFLAGQRRAEIPPDVRHRLEAMLSELTGG
jgi:mycothiol system anti-sigma-R factor